MARKGIYQAGVDRLGMWKVVIARGGIQWGEAGKYSEE